MCATQINTKPLSAQHMLWLFEEPKWCSQASNVFPSLKPRHTFPLPLAAHHHSFSPSLPRDPDAQSSFTQISLSPSPHPHSPGSCVNTHTPPALNKPSTQPLNAMPLLSRAATGELRWQLYKCWQSVPEQHWFCSNQSGEIAMHGKWHRVP